MREAVARGRLEAAHFAVEPRSCFRPGVLESEYVDVEARAFARYLVGRTPPAEIVERYRAADATLFATPPAAVDASLVAFVRRHPWSVWFLDPAVGLLRPGSLLRNKVLVMAAILETSPAFADEFLSRPVHPVVLALRVIGLGTLAVLRAGLGMVLYPAAARARA